MNAHSKNVRKNDASFCIFCISSLLQPLTLVAELFNYHAKLTWSHAFGKCFGFGSDGIFVERHLLFSYLFPTLDYELLPIMKKLHLESNVSSVSFYEQLIHCIILIQVSVLNIYRVYHKKHSTIHTGRQAAAKTF